MGGAASTEEDIKSRKIGWLMRRQYAEDIKIVKILLLGTGGCGKSTTLKQMRLLYPVYTDFPIYERERFTSVVYQNVLSDMQTLLKACESLSPISSEENERLARKILNLSAEVDGIDEEVAKMLHAVWKDKGVQESWHMRSHLQVQASLVYYMERVMEIGRDDYVPNTEDVLNTRTRTTGIVEEQFLVDKVKIVVYDVAGQRSERRKWFHAFENMHAILFIAAMSEYDQVLLEDDEMNRQEESLQVFASTSSNVYFSKVGFILFLNKHDLFLQKLPVFPFRLDDGPNRRNTTFEGPHCVPGTPSSVPGTQEFDQCATAAAAYLKDLYLNNFNNQSCTRELYTHVTTATSTDNMRVIFNAVKDMFLRINLRENGFM